MADNKTEDGVENGHLLGSDPKLEDSATNLSPRRPASRENVQASETEFTPPDGGWGWLVCIVSFWTNGTLFGVLNTFGLLFVKLVDEFGDEGDDSIAFKTCKYFYTP